MGFYFYKLKVCGNPALSKSISTIFSNNICSLCISVSYFWNSCDISDFFVVIFVTMICDQWSFFFWNSCSFIYLFIYLWLCWVFVSVRGPSLVAASGGHSSSRCTGLPPSRPLLSRSTGSRRAGSAIVAHGPSRSAACGILPDQGSSPCPLHWQADSQPLCHQGSPISDLWCYYCLKITTHWRLRLCWIFFDHKYFFMRYIHFLDIMLLHNS